MSENNKLDTRSAALDAASKRVLVLTETRTTVYELDDEDIERVIEGGVTDYCSLMLDSEKVSAYLDRNDGTPHYADYDTCIQPLADTEWMMDRPPVPANGPTQWITQARGLVSRATGLMAKARYLEGDIDVVDAAMRQLNGIGDGLRIEQNRMNGLDANARPLEKDTP